MTKGRRLYDHVQQRTGMALETAMNAAGAVTESTVGAAKGTVTALTLYVPPYLQLPAALRDLFLPESEREKRAAYSAAQTVHRVSDAARNILGSQT